MGRGPDIGRSLTAAIALLAGAAQAAGPGPAAPGPVINETRRYYALDATGLESLRLQLAERAREAGLERGAIGMTRHELETSYRLEPLPSGCRLGGLAVRMDLTMDLPEWTPAGPTRRGLRERWQRMLSALTRHEEGHRENAMWLAHEVHRRLSSLAEAKDCKALGKLAQRELFRVKLRFELREQTYDRRTGHGVGQGSVL